MFSSKQTVTRRSGPTLVVYLESDIIRRYRRVFVH